MLSSNKKKYTPEQWAWCENYQSRTMFDPMMDSFEVGEKSFYEAAQFAIRWYEDHSKDAYLSVSNNVPGWEVEHTK